MDFKNWIIKEMSHVFADNLFFQNKEIVAIDMMFENYPEQYKPMLKLWMWHFCAKWPEGGYISYHNRAKEKLQLSSTPCHHSLSILPEDWFDYTKIVFADNSIKNPIK